MKISGSKPRQLIPYVNQEGILRFRGRLQFANIPEDVKHQITPLHLQIITTSVETWEQSLL